jgi:PAS domain S-box-containing protein
MTVVPDGSVSRQRYEREQRARAEAEALLEAKARELFDANKRLILESELVRSALLQTEEMRAREAAALKETSIVSASLAALSGKRGADIALQALLDVLRAEFAVDDACFVQPSGETIIISAAARPESVDIALPIRASLLSRARRAGNLAALASDATIPAFLQDIASVIIAPISLGEEKIGALVLMSSQSGYFTMADLRVLGRVSQLTSQALLALREARRNALLASIVEGRQPDNASNILDAPLEAVHRALARVTLLQSEVVGIIDSILAAPLTEADASIVGALGRVGRALQADRLQVMQMTTDGAHYECTHAWKADRVGPAPQTYQRVPSGILHRWAADLAAGTEVLVANVAQLPDTAPEKPFLEARGVLSLLAVPMLEGGNLLGYVSFEFLQDTNGFLPGERHLLRSVGKVIISVLARRDAERQLSASHAEALAQRARVEAVLAAMPEVILELDRMGRLLACHSDLNLDDAEGMADYGGRQVEEVLPDEFSGEIRNALSELSEHGLARQRDIRYDRNNITRWWRMTATLIGDRGFLIVLQERTLERARTAEIERLSEIARRTTNLVVVTDAQRRIEWVNTAFEQTTGWRLDEIRGRNAGRFLQAPTSDPDTIAHIRRQLDAGLPVQAEILNQSRSGREYWVALDIQPLRRPDGSIHGFMAVEADITERRAQAERLKRLAEAAAAAQATLVAAVESLQDGFVLFDADDRLVICNEKYREIYASSAPSIVPGATFESILRYGLAHGEYAQAIGREEAWLAERMERHLQPNSEIEQPLSDGRWLRIFEKATPTGGRVGLRVDITALKLAERRALSDRATAMEASQDGIAITDAEGRFTYMNKAHLALFGMTSEAEIIGRSWTTLYAPDARDWLQSHAIPILRSQGRWSGEIVGVAQDGTPVDQDVSLTLNDDGGLLCITRDISQRRRGEEERDRLRDELHMAQRREIIGQLAAGLAHDFNNLLAAISGNASLIEGSVEPGTANAASAERILSATRQAAGLVSRLMGLGARPTERQLIDLRKPVADAAELVRTSIRPPLSLQVDLPETAQTAPADTTDIVQVVLNLAINARDALADQPGRISIQLRPATAADVAGEAVVGAIDPGRSYLCLEVADTGPGIPPDIAAQIFRPWFTTKGSQGTGVGLAVVSSVVGNNGGAIRLLTSAQAGTRFIVLWPISQPQSAPRLASPLPDRLSGRLDGLMILVVDDQPDVLQVIVAMLEAAGAEVAPATDPRDVVQAVREDPGLWDLLVTDFDMPAMSGAELADAVHAHDPDLPILLVTALAGVADRTSARFHAVLGKPIDRARLVSSAESAVRSTSKRV